MLGWDYSECYVAACGCCFSSYGEGRRHEEDCAECRRIIHRDDEEPEDDD